MVAATLNLNNRIVSNNVKAQFARLVLALKQYGKLKITISSKIVDEDPYYNQLEFSTTCVVKLDPENITRLLIESAKDTSYNKVHLSQPLHFTGLRFCDFMQHKKFQLTPVILLSIQYDDKYYEARVDAIDIDEEIIS